MNDLTQPQRRAVSILQQSIGSLEPVPQSGGEWEHETTGERVNEKTVRTLVQMGVLEASETDAYGRPMRVQLAEEVAT